MGKTINLPEALTLHKERHWYNGVGEPALLEDIGYAIEVYDTKRLSI